jgi:hypothetical protein
MRIDDIFLDEQRGVADGGADLLVGQFFRDNQQAILYQYLQAPASQLRDLNLSPAVQQFLLSSRPKPVWYDEEKILAGQALYKKYAQEVMTLLGSMALPYCYLASPGNKAIYLSEKMSYTAGKRLRETSQFIMDVLTPGHLQADHFGHIQINKTRLIHAIARHYLKRNMWDPGWGAPISQEDMAGTNLAFSSTILKGLKDWGFKITDEQGENFLLVWRYIGYQLHIHDDLLPTSFAEAMTLEAAIGKRHFKKSEEGIALARSLVDYYKEYFAGIRTNLIEPQIVYFVGKENAKLLGLSTSRTQDRVVNSLNALRRFINSFYVNPDSYKNMIVAQELLKVRINVGDKKKG